VNISYCTLSASLPDTAEALLHCIQYETPMMHWSKTNNSHYNPSNHTTRILIQSFPQPLARLSVIHQVVFGFHVSLLQYVGVRTNRMCTVSIGAGRRAYLATEVPKNPACRPNGLVSGEEEVESEDLFFQVLFLPETCVHQLSQEYKSINFNRTTFYLN